MRLNILHVIDNKVMPRQLLQFPKSPFFGSLIIVLILGNLEENTGLNLVDFIFV